MTVELSRRDFMKCTGLTVLAVASSGLLTACGQAATYPAEATINGVKVSLKGYETVVGFTGFGQNYSVIKVVFNLENTTDTEKQLSTSIGQAIDAAIASDYSKLISMFTGTSSNFSVSPDSGTVLVKTDIAYQNGKAVAKLDAKATGTVELYIAISGTWRTMNLTYKPPFGTGNFTLSAGDLL